MKAVVHSRYGSPDVLRLEEIPKPSAKDNEVLIKVRAAAVNPIDWHYIRGSPFLMRVMTGLVKPKIGRVGSDVAGEVETVGKNVTQFKPGDAVFGICRGSLAEYVCTPESAIVRSNNLTFEQAASIPVAGLTALQGLRDFGKVQPGHNVLINGAAGGVGTFAVQVAKALGATVTGVCSTRNVERVRSIGADHVIDYTREDFAKGEQRYDAVLDCAWHHSISESRSILKSDGHYVLIGVPGDQTAAGFVVRLAQAAMAASLFKKRTFVMFVAKSSAADLAQLRDWIEGGKITPVIDRTYPLTQAADAIRYLEEGHARGKILILV